MAQLKILPRIPDCFIDLADLILSAVIKQAGEARRIDFVADQYPSVSIKGIERERQGRSGQLAVRIRSPQQLCPRQWKKFLANGLIKTNLMEFLADVWGTDQRFAKKIRERTLFLIKSSDTDVEVLACYFREYISADIFLLCGTRSRARVINRELKQTTTTTATRTSSNKRFNEQNNGYARAL